MNHRKSLLMAIAVFFLSSAYTQLFAQDDVISKRKSIMGANSKAATAIQKAAQEADYATIETKAKEIMGNMDAVVKLFPQGSTSEKSRAHADIWVKTDEFNSRAAATRKAAEALSKAAAAKNEADVSTKVKDLGSTREGTCGECHKIFRKDFRKDS